MTGDVSDTHEYVLHHVNIWLPNVSTVSYRYQHPLSSYLRREHRTKDRYRPLTLPTPIHGSHSKVWLGLFSLAPYVRLE